MTPFTSKIIWLSALLALGELTARAQAVRVTAWDVAAPAQPGKTAPASVEEIAQKLKQLAPDVVLLRRVTGWKMCSQLAEAMKPADYRVVACSAFHDSGANVGVAPNQVAIMARNAAYFPGPNRGICRSGDRRRGVSRLRPCRWAAIASAFPASKYLAANCRSRKKRCVNG